MMIPSAAVLSCVYVLGLFFLGTSGSALLREGAILGWIYAIAFVLSGVAAAMVFFGLHTRAVKRAEDIYPDITHHLSKSTLVMTPSYAAGAVVFAYMIFTYATLLYFPFEKNIAEFSKESFLGVGTPWKYGALSIFLSFFDSLLVPLITSVITKKGSR